MKLERWIKLVGITQSELARAVGCSAPTINRHLRLGRVLDPEVIVRIYFLTMGDVRPDDFYDLENAPPENIEALKAAMAVHSRLRAQKQTPSSPARKKPSKVKPHE